MLSSIPRRRPIAACCGSKARTSLKNITDGTSKTVLGGEVGRATSESSHAFGGDFDPGLWLGEANAVLSKVHFRSSAEGGDGGRFGGAHPGVVMFVMCDGSVQAISQRYQFGGARSHGHPRRR